MKIKKEKVYLVRKYYNMSIAMRAGWWFVICNILQRGIQFFLTPVYTRLLTTSEYGNYSLFLTWLNIFTVFATLNLSGGIYYNGLLKYEKYIRKYTLSLQMLGNISTCITFFTLFVIYPFVYSIVKIEEKYLFLMFLILLFQPSTLLWMTEKRMQFSYKTVIIVTLILSSITPVMGIFILKVFHLGVYGIILSYTLINCGIGVIFFVKNFKEGMEGISVYWIEALRFSVPLIPHYLSQMILGQADRIMINYYNGDSKAGIYTLAYQIGLALTIIVNGITNSFTPWLYKRLKIRFFEHVDKAILILTLSFSLLSLVLVLLAPEIIEILGTQEYYEAVYVISPIVLSTLITFVFGLFGTVLFYYEETKYVTFASAIGASTNIILNMMFIPLYGYFVAGYTTFISSFIMLIIYYLFLIKCCKKNNISFRIFKGKEIFLIILIITVISFSLMLTYHLTTIRFAILGLLIVIGIVCQSKITLLLKKLLISM